MFLFSRALWGPALVAGGLLTGCQSLSKPVAHGPLYDLPAIASVQPTALMPVTIVDQRPDWERHYYRGATEPERHENAVTFLAAENFRPSLFRKLEEHLAAQLVQQEHPPTWAEFELHSFRVVINRRDELRHTLMAHRADPLAARREAFEAYQDCRAAHRLAVKEAKEHGDPPPPPCDCAYPEPPAPNYGFGVAISSDGMDGGAGLAGAAVAVGIMGATLLAEEIQEKERILPGPPPDLPEDYGENITCEVRGQLILHFSDGRIEKQPLSALSRSLPGPTPPGILEQDLPATVDQAIRNLRVEGTKTLPEEPELLPGATPPIESANIDEG